MNIDVFLARHRLPAEFAETAARWYEPLARWAGERLRQERNGACVIGINGAQGSGKSTLSSFLNEYLASDSGCNVVELSIDDLYLTRAERESLAARIHPLLATRGVPGTHDVALGRRVLEALRDAGPGERVSVPRFDKSVDDRVPQADWPQVEGPVDLVVFEGWCVASLAEDDASLSPPVNELERDEDPDGQWRGYANRALAGNYAALFGMLDALVFLAVPDFASVYRWRLEQEHKLRDRAAASATRVMSDAEVGRFVQHFERITRNNLQRLPAIADVVLELDPQHRVAAVRYDGADGAGNGAND